MFSKFEKSYTRRKVLVLFFLVVATISCDLHLFSNETEVAEIMMRIVDTGSDNTEELFPVVSNVEFNFTRITLSNQQQSEIQFNPPAFPLAIVRFNEDVDVTEGILQDPVYNRLNLVLGGDNQLNEPDSLVTDPVLITGVYNDSEFSFKIEQQIELDFRLAPPINVHAKHGNSVILRINADKSLWFTDPVTDEILSPGEESNRNLIINNIRESISVDLFQPVISINDADTVIGAENIDFEVNLSEPVLSTVEVDFYTANQSAKADVDYIEANGTLVFHPGDTTKTISVQLLENFHRAPHRRFRVLLSNASVAKLDNRHRRATGMILNNPENLPQIIINDTEATLNDTFITFYTQLSDEPEKAVTVDFQTSDLSASAGTDYAEKSGTLTFEPGEMVKPITVELLENSFNAPNRKFRMQLSNATHANLVQSKSMATGYIINIDAN